MLLVQMENSNHEQYPASGLPGVFEIPGEPAVVINGVPEAAPASDGTIICCNEVTDEKPSRTTNFGEWLEGREVQKLFGGQYFFGKVTMFDKDAGWYRVVYDDGDFEDLEWNELEQVLLPLDVTIPLKTLAMKMLRSLNPTCTSPRKGSHTTKHSTSEVKKKATLSGGKRGRPRKVDLENMEVSAIFSSLTEVPIVEKIEENSIPVVVIQGVLVEKAEVNGKSSGKRRGRPRKNQVEKLDENARQTMLAGVLVDATFPGFTKGAHVEKVEEHGKPSGKKRGRPRKLEAVKVEEKESAKMTTAGALLENINGNINLSVFTEAASVENVPEKQKPSGKKRGRPRKVQMEIVDSHAKLPVLTAGDSVQKFVDSAKPAVALEEEVEESAKFPIVKFKDNRQLPVVIQDASVGKVGESGNLSGKKRGRPRKVQVEISEENAMLVVGTKRPLMGMVEVGMATDGETDCPRQLQARKSFNPSGRKRGRPRKLQPINVEQEVKQTSIVNAETLALVDKAAVVESVEQCEKL